MLDSVECKMMQYIFKEYSEKLSSLGQEKTLSPLLRNLSRLSLPYRVFTGNFLAQLKVWSLSLEIY